MPFDAQAQGEYMSIGAPPISPFANREGFSQAPYALFQSQEIYALEQKTIFQGRSWNYLCLEVELAEPGDYVATHAGHTPVIVVRAEDGFIYAFEIGRAHV